MASSHRQVEWDYTELAKTYTLRPPYAGRAVDRIVAACGRANPRVADIGAGNGHLTVELVSRDCVIDAVEPNDAMREIGVARTEGTQATWHVAVGEDTGLPADTYDLVTFGSSFAVTNRPDALRETARILRRPGWFACLWNHRDLTDPLQMEIESRIRARIPDYGYGARREDQAPVIEESGLFETPVVLREPVRYTVEVSDWLAAWRSHGILERQAGPAFESILVDIDEHVLSLGVEKLEIPYETVGWIAAVRQDGGRS